MFEMAGLRARPREGDTSAVQDVRKEILGSAWTLRNTCEKGRATSESWSDVFLAEIRDFDITHLDTGVPELEGDPEKEGAVVSQRQAEKTRRLMQLWSAQDLTGLDTEERAAQEQETMKVYTTFDEEGLDTALATA
jgi:hypothetical protein